MKTIQRIVLLIISTTLIVCSLCLTAFADNTGATLSVEMEFYDKDMLMIDRISTPQLSSNYTKHTYPADTKYIKVTTVSDDDKDKIDISINGKTYKDYAYRDISKDQQCYIKVSTTDSVTKKEAAYSLQLDRSVVTRDNAISAISWSLYNKDDNPLPTSDIVLLEEANTIIIPSSVSTISLDYFTTNNPFTTVNVVMENSTQQIGNDGPILVDTSKQKTTVYVEAQIDDTFTTYNLVFTKAAEASSDNTLVSLDVEGYSAADYFAPVTVTLAESVLEYSAIVPTEATEFCIYPQTNHIMATLESTAEGVVTDENGITFYPIEKSCIISIVVTAENGDAQTYTISVLKGAVAAENAFPDLPPATPESFFQSNMWIIIPAIIIIIAASVLVVLQIRKRRY